MLWNRSLVMQDLETGSLWSHILGKAMAGPLKGAELDLIPAVMTDWRSWREQHPDTTVLALSRTGREYTAQFQKRPETFVLGISLGERAKAYPFDVLARWQVINDIFLSRPVVATFDVQSTAAQLFDRTVGERVLTFGARPDGLMEDAETGSLWHLIRGDCLEGELQGAQLRPMPAIVSFRHVWAQFHPKTELFSGSNNRK
jgi:hypothetical protein